MNVEFINNKTNEFYKSMWKFKTKEIIAMEKSSIRCGVFLQNSNFLKRKKNSRNVCIDKENLEILKNF